MVPQERRLARARGLPLGRRGVPAAAALLLIGLQATCAADRTPELFGTWQAERLIQEGDTVKVDLANVSLQFAPDLTYVYTSTLDHVEPGTYRLDGMILSVNPDPPLGLGEQKLQVLRLDSVSLHLRMRDEGRERLLEFARVSDASTWRDPRDSAAAGPEAIDMDTTYYPADSLDPAVEID